MRMCQTLDIGAYQNYTKSIRLGFLQLQPDIRPSGRELKRKWRFCYRRKQPARAGFLFARFVAPKKRPCFSANLVQRNESNQNFPDIFAAILPR